MHLNSTSLGRFAVGCLWAVGMTIQVVFAAELANVCLYANRFRWLSLQYRSVRAFWHVGQMWKCSWAHLICSSVLKFDTFMLPCNWLAVMFGVTLGTRQYTEIFYVSSRRKKNHMPRLSKYSGCSHPHKYCNGFYARNALLFWKLTQHSSDFVVVCCDLDAGERYFSINIAFQSLY